LLAALAVLALVALLVVGSVATTVLAQRSSRLAHSDALLTAAADYALDVVLGDPTGYALADLPYGTARTFDVAVPGSAQISATVAATRVRAGVVWLVASSTLDGVDQGTRRVNLIAHFTSIGPLPSAAIVSRGRVALASDVALRADTATEPDCGAASLAADLILAPGVEVDGAGTAHVAYEQSASDSATYFITDRQLAALSGASPFVHVRGDTAIAGGSFTGILVVDGSLTITGPFVANGLVVARGRIDAKSGGLTVVGGLMSFAAPTDGTPAIDLAGASITADGCAIARAFRVAFPPRPVRDRSWAELF
jgi:hypothetical protein